MTHDPKAEGYSKNAAQHARKPSLTEAFTKSARRRFTTLLLGTALISGCATTMNGTSPAAAAAPAQDAAAQTTLVQTGTVQGLAPPAPVQMTAEETARRTEIRAILLGDAQQRYPELAASAANAYSAELQTLQKELNGYLKHGGDTAMHNAIVILDPAKIDVAVALGVPLRAAIHYEASQHGKLPDGSMAVAASNNAVKSFRTEAGITTYTQNPSAYPNMNNPEAQPCLIIPASDHAYPFVIPGFTYAQKIEFTNIHEGWHCLDTRYRMTEKQMEALSAGNPRDMTQLILSPDLLTATSVIHHKETLADVAAMGDMVRHGHDVSIIDYAMSWRQENVRSDYMHYSSPALKALKTEITTMSVDTFRALSADQARETYFRVTEAEALNVPRLQAMAMYLMGDGEIRGFLRHGATTAPDVARGIAYADEIMKPAPPQQPLKDIIVALAPPDTALRQQLVDWRPLDRLEETAVAQGGKITPETLVRAYGSLQSDLHGQLTGDDPRVAREKMSLLKGIFTRYVRTVDYVEANARHGVDIEQAEKTLFDKHRAAPAATAAAPAITAPPAGEAAAPVQNYRGHSHGGHHGHRHP